jgi:hypothetical protein
MTDIRPARPFAVDEKGPVTLHVDLLKVPEPSNDAELDAVRRLDLHEHVVAHPFEGFEATALDAVTAIVDPVVYSNSRAEPVKPHLEFASVSARARLLA